ncbi:hypothetical protein ACSAZL_07485 [Methanosarcina sp. T3]|uniref:hypothetical protein n=1 Tax=Methanosarcina sp. T3 TaxID=3439062 RepID=UPI003F84DF39
MSTSGLKTIPITTATSSGTMIPLTVAMMLSMVLAASKIPRKSQLIMPARRSQYGALLENSL